MKKKDQPLLNTHLPFPKEQLLTYALNLVSLHEEMCIYIKYLFTSMFVDENLLTKSLLQRLTPHAPETRASRRSLRWLEESASANECTSLQPTAQRGQGRPSFVHTKAKWDSILHLERNDWKGLEREKYFRYRANEDYLLKVLCIHNNTHLFKSYLST